ncbi:MAG: response regulator transcription factor [Chloroflexota bacterium]
MPTQGAWVLVVDDDAEVRALVSAALRVGGWGTRAVASGVEALAELRDGPAAVVLDINLDGETGYDVCRAIRATSAVPVIFLTARQDELDEVLGLELGADDFITKPFSPRILAARVGAAVRRGAAGTSEEVARYGPLTIDRRARRVLLDGREVALTKVEFDLLSTLADEPDRAWSRDALIDRVWGAWYSDGHVVDVTVGRLRRKLADAGLPDAIGTVRGVGYRFGRGEPGTGA